MTVRVAMVFNPFGVACAGVKTAVFGLGVATGVLFNGDNPPRIPYRSQSSAPCHVGSYIGEVTISGVLSLNTTVLSSAARWIAFHMVVGMRPDAPKPISNPALFEAVPLP